MLAKYPPTGAPGEVPEYIPIKTHEDYYAMLKKHDLDDSNKIAMIIAAINKLSPTSSEQSMYAQNLITFLETNSGESYQKLQPFVEHQLLYILPYPRKVIMSLLRKAINIPSIDLRNSLTMDILHYHTRDTQLLDWMKETRAQQDYMKRVRDYLKVDTAAAPSTMAAAPLTKAAPNAQIYTRLKPYERSIFFMLGEAQSYFYSALEYTASFYMYQITMIKGPQIINDFESIMFNETHPLHRVLLNLAVARGKLSFLEIETTKYSNSGSARRISLANAELHSLEKICIEKIRHL